MWKRFLATAGAATALASVLAAGQLHVPGHFTELQDAIDNAQPGDTIIVHGGVFDPITIDKPLTIVGEPRPYIRLDRFSSHLPVSPHVALAGDGSGVLVLRNLQIGPGSVDTIFTDPAISGGGFEELHIHDSHVEAAFYPVSYGCCFDGKAALSTDIPQVFVSGSTLLASNSDSAVCGFLPERPPRPGVDAPGSTVVVVDSLVEGGGQYWLCWDQGCLDPDFVKANLLAPAVRANELFEADSTLLGGHVFHFFEDLDPNHNSQILVSCGEGPRADPLDVVQHVPFPLRMRAFTDLRLGQTWTVYWTASAGSAFSTLFLSTKALLPPLEMTSGWLFLDFAGLFPPRTVYGNNTRRFDHAVPVNSSLIGLEVIAQVYDSNTGFTHPIADCVGPLVVPAQIEPPQPQ